MTNRDEVGLRPVSSEDLPAVGAFLHRHLNARLSAEDWADCLRPTWKTEVPTHGYLLESGGAIVGVYAAIYSEQRDGADVRKVCNLAAWCVLEDHRGHALRLVRSMLSDRDRVLVDLSPSGNVVALNERLGFRHLDTAGALVVNLPGRGRRLRLLSRPDDVAAALGDGDRAAFEDHRASRAARHLAVVDGDRVCWVVYRRVRRKRLPLFAAVLHVSDPVLFAEAAGRVYRHLLGRGILFTLVESRVVGGEAVPWHAVRLARQRPKMVRVPAGVPGDEVSQLYSELTQVPW